MSAQQILVNTLGGKCSQCGSTEQLQLHHKDRNRKNNDLENIVLLCRKCHINKHGHLGGKRKTVILDTKLWHTFQDYSLTVTGSSCFTTTKVEDALREYMINHPVKGA